MTTAELHKILDDENRKLSLAELKQVIYEMKEDAFNEFGKSLERKSLNRQDIRNIGFYDGEQNAFQIVLDLADHLDIGAQTITLDGTTQCYATRDTNGIHITMCANKGDNSDSGRVEVIPFDNCPTVCDYRIDISDKSYIALVKSLLSFADRSELIRILNNPIDGACWTIATRKTKGKENTTNDN